MTVHSDQPIRASWWSGHRPGDRLHDGQPGPGDGPRRGPTPGAATGSPLSEHSPLAEGSGGGPAEGAAISHRSPRSNSCSPDAMQSRPPVSSLSAAIPYAASRRTAVPGSVTLLSRSDVLPCTAARDLVKGRAWPDTEGVTGSIPVAPTTWPLTSENAACLFPPEGPSRKESV